MSTKGRVILRDVWQMLDKCLEKYSVDEGPHHFRVKHAGRTYPSFPKGEHAKKPGRAEIQRKHVRDLAEFFDILDCAKHHLEILR